MKHNLLYMLVAKNNFSIDFSNILLEQDFICSFFVSPTELLSKNNSPALLILDAALCEGSLPDFIRHYHAQHPVTQIIVMVNSNQSLLASEALQAGAIDYLQKPFTAAQFHRVISDSKLLTKPYRNLIVSSVVSQKVLQLARRVAQTDASVLITGESGTGKERLAQFIHEHSPRAQAPFIAINCAAIPETMLEAILFGVNKGAFTGAVKSQPGKFEQAQGGTLLLDEIGDMPMNLQAKLLRVIQERETERLGSTQRIKLDVRIIAATNQDLRMQVRQGTFREDLFYRLDVLPLSWPALRDRREDIQPLAMFFLQKYAADTPHQLSPAAIRKLQQYRWPGNVRELENVMQRALILAKGLVLQPEDLQLSDDMTGAMMKSPSMLGSHESAEASFSAPPAASLSDSRQQAEFEYVLTILRRFKGHRTRTAEALGMTTRALRYKLAAMREIGIDIDCLVNN